MRENTYREMMLAFELYPVEVEKYGGGLVAKVLRKCGSTKQKQVFKEIEAAATKLKTPIKLGKIENIIRKHSRN